MLWVCLLLSLGTCMASPMVSEIQNITSVDKMALELMGFHRSSRAAFYFLVSSSLVDWDTAVKACESQETHLVSIEDSVKETAVLGFLASKGVKEAWTAGQDLLENGKYFWITTMQPIGPYTHWRTGVAPAHPDRSCIAINHRSTTDCLSYAGYRWDEESCATKKAFICEIRM